MVNSYLHASNNTTTTIIIIIINATLLYVLQAHKYLNYVEFVFIYLFIYLFVYLFIYLFISRSANSVYL